MVIAAVAMFDTRRGALPDVAGGATGGLAGGFYPFWSAAVVFAFGGLVAWRALATPQPAQGVFRDRTSVTSVLWIVVPMLVSVALIKYIGFYLMTALYMGFFAAAIGRYRPQWIALISVTFPAVIYAVFEVGFRTLLPKSIFYDILRF